MRANMRERVTGLHHLTAIAGDPRRNYEFYTGLLGLRLVKKTVNFDDPGTYHLYYGDGEANPGSVITFFSWTAGQRGRRGPGQISDVSFSIPEGGIGYWAERLKEHNVETELDEAKFGRDGIRFNDPDGLQLGLVEEEDLSATSWKGSVIPDAYAIGRICGVSVSLGKNEPTGRFLEEALGMNFVGELGGERKFGVNHAGSDFFINLIQSGDHADGRIGVGSVHHLAWKVEDEQRQSVWKSLLEDHGLRVTSVADRKYFKSIYFREPGGILFEMATEDPGFAVDETKESLGEGLMLPGWLEHRRKEIENSLPPLVMGD